MSRADLEPLSPEAERLLAKEREFPPAPAELRARAMARARASLGLGTVRPLRRSLHRRPTLLIAASLALAFAAVSFAAWYDGDPRGTNPTPASGTSQPAGKLATDPPGTPPSEVEAEEVRNEPSPEPRKLEEPTPPSRRTPAEDATGLELAVLQRARAAVAKQEFSAALELIADHQRRFPRGKLREEREALRVKALAGLGRTDEAQRAAERFRERFPNSVLSPRIEATARPAP